MKSSQIIRKQENTTKKGKAIALRELNVARSEVLWLGGGGQGGGQGGGGGGKGGQGGGGGGQGGGQI